MAPSEATTPPFDFSSRSSAFPPPVPPVHQLLSCLRAGLSIELTQLLSIPAMVLGRAADHSGRRSVNRLGDGTIVDMPTHTLRYLSSDLTNKEMEPILAEFHAMSLEDFGELIAHDGEQFLYVLDGVLELHTEAYAPLLLQAGDSVHFDGRMGHAYVAREAPCRALSIRTGLSPSATFRPPSPDLDRAGVSPPARGGRRRPAPRTGRKRRRL